MTSSSRYLNLNTFASAPYPSSLVPHLDNFGEPLLALHREVNRMFDDLFRTSLWPITAAQQVTQQAQQAAQQAAKQAVQLLSSPRLDLEELDDEVLITTDLPGVALSDVEVKIEGQTLTICGERNYNGNSNRSNNRDEGNDSRNNSNSTRQESKQQENFHLLERSRGRFERVIQLPFAAKPEEIEASFDNGVLCIRLPKEERQRSRRIEVRSANQASRQGNQDHQGAQGNNNSLNGQNKNQGSQPSSVGNMQNKPSSVTSAADSSRNKQPQPA